MIDLFSYSGENNIKDIKERGRDEDRWMDKNLTLKFNHGPNHDLKSFIYTREDHPFVIFHFPACQLRLNGIKNSCITKRENKR